MRCESLRVAAMRHSNGFTGIVPMPCSASRVVRYFNTTTGRRRLTFGSPLPHNLVRGHSDAVREVETAHLRPRGDAQAPLVLREQLVGQAARLAAEHQHVACGIGWLG